MYRRLRDQGQLSVRIDFSYNIDPAEPLDKAEAELRHASQARQRRRRHVPRRRDRRDRSRRRRADRASGARLSWQAGYRGLQKVPTDQFKRFAALVAKYGYRLRPHAVGDAAIDEALDAFEYANSQTPIVKRRWMIDHAFLLGPQHYDRVKRLGVIINSQYMHNYQLGALILKAWKRPLADRSEPYAEWLRNGVMFAGGSDGPISYHAEPLLEIYGEVTRGTGWGGRLGPDQGISALTPSAR